jgi:hypothetical protein
MILPPLVFPALDIKRFTRVNEKDECQRKKIHFSIMTTDLALTERPHGSIELISLLIHIAIKLRIVAFRAQCYKTFYSCNSGILTIS